VRKNIRDYPSESGLEAQKRSFILSIKEFINFPGIISMMLVIGFLMAG
jgi:hypothetical protein